MKHEELGRRFDIRFCRKGRRTEAKVRDWMIFPHDRLGVFLQNLHADFATTSDLVDRVNVGAKVHR